MLVFTVIMVFALPAVCARRLVYPDAREQCGAFCASLLLKHYELVAPIEEVCVALPADPTDNVRGTSLEQITEFLHHQGLHAVGVGGVRLQDLLEVIDPHVVTAIAYVERNRRGHFSMIAASSGNKALVADLWKVKWVSPEGDFGQLFATDNGRGTCLLVSDNLSALRGAVRSLGLSVPPELLQTPRICFEATVTEFSPDDVRDGQVTRNFEFRNCGDGLLVIHGMRVPCGCISASSSSSVLQPGEQGSVEVIVHCEHWGEGGQEKSVYVLTNAPGAAAIALLIRGRCSLAHTEAPPVPTDQLLWYPQELMLGSLCDASEWVAQEHPITIKGCLEKTSRIESVDCDIPYGKVRVEKAPRDRGGRPVWKAFLELEGLPENGKLQGTIAINLGGECKGRIVIPVRGRPRPLFVVAPPAVHLILPAESTVARGRARIYSPCGLSFRLGGIETHVSNADVSVGTAEGTDGQVLEFAVRPRTGVTEVAGAVLVHIDHHSQSTVLSIPLRCYVATSSGDAGIPSR